MRTSSEVRGVPLQYKDDEQRIVSRGKKLVLELNDPTFQNALPQKNIEGRLRIMMTGTGYLDGPPAYSDALTSLASLAGLGPSTSKPHGLDE